MNHTLGMLLSPAYFFDMESNRILAAKGRFQQMMGDTRDKLLSMTLEQLRPPEDLRRLQHAPDQAPPKAWSSGDMCYSTASIYVLISYRNNGRVDEDGRSRWLRLVVVSRFGANQSGTRTSSSDQTRL